MVEHVKHVKHVKHLKFGNNKNILKTIVCKVVICKVYATPDKNIRLTANYTNCNTVYKILARGKFQQ